MTTTQILARAAAANNRRLNSLAMTGDERRAAEEAVKAGLMTMHHARWPGYGMVKLYQARAEQGAAGSCNA